MRETKLDSVVRRVSMSFTQNYNRNVFGPIQWKLMGPIADRPATAEENTTYVSTDEGDGLLRAYIYTGGSWMKMQGIDGFTGGGGGSSLPTDPASDGTYVLENTVSGGTGTLSWGSGGGGSGSVVNVPISVETVDDTTTYTLGLTWAEIDELTDAGAVLYHKTTADTEDFFGMVGDIVYVKSVYFSAGDEAWGVDIQDFAGNSMQLGTATEDGYPYYIDGGK